MDLNGMGLLGAIIIGGLAGWLAEKFMKSDMGLLMNIILGIVGAVVLNFLLSLVGIGTGTGWLVYLIVGFIGASLLIAIARMVRR
ncbi:GlsB/YeaQ/YmgE family stress response membrane protein [Pseudohoeflea coraliihabitans]|uniref:GlsB/YeaQ/YmgE family stress response membrane protein n=1 Tax=Pseudohoeflea coraliihabitans TaxID=2860393 RepID=A0ABS6WS36_9HYPH|nr:GlsB/YeaQ/YmgE family stress response membrane protein [Pseudohoeflea sp. DP4N28-3]MBW3098463.1 GlsB/YeaQ/YmgE family stress response membrane protein [Pseudohoeflea sp. DP4N28-3]